MKIARATDADIEMALELAGAIDAMTQNWWPAMPSKIAHSDDYEPFDIDDSEQCTRVCKYLTELAGKGSLFRVVCGMAAVLDPKNNITDPNADTLEPSPYIQAMESALAAVVAGQPDAVDKAHAAIALAKAGVK